MATRLVNVVIDSADPHELAGWWSQALRWPAEHHPDESDVKPPPDTPGVELVFVPVYDERVVKNRLHLDLASQSAGDQQAMVERLLSAGARWKDIGQGDVPWTVMADPEGNEFCVADPWPAYGNTGPIAAITVDCVAPGVVAAFWEQAAGWTVQASSDAAVSLRATTGRGPWLAFTRTGEPHTVKNRVHLDVAGFRDDDQAAEVERLIRAGALRAEVGQSDLPEGQLSWVVLTDPEQNEFCVLSSRN